MKIHIYIPTDAGQQSLWAASITQAAATLYVGGGTEVTEDEAIDKAIQMYAGVLDKLAQGTPGEPETL